MKRHIRNREAGVAMFTALLALLVLSVIGAGMVYMTTTESQVNYNYRSEQVAYFAAKAGMEEARDRMMGTNANTINGILPTSAPANGGGIVYILNEGNAAGSVQPWNASTTNPYMDDELCHDGYSLSGLTSVPQDVRCTTVPNGAGWYQTVTSTLPWNGTSAALQFKWVRIALKLNGSIQNFPVNAGTSLNQPVCWNGANEVILTGPNCQSMTPTATPVYLVTSLAVSSTGARKMVQADVAVTPSQPSGGFGLFATGTGCGAMTLSGGMTTDSWTSANGGTYATTNSQTGGSVGANGNVSMSGNGTQVGGNVGANNTTQGACPDGITASGGAGLVPNMNPPNVFVAVYPPLVLPTPPAPNPTPPTTAASFTTSQGKSATMVPGTYGNISLTGGTTLTLSPGVYNINSISLSGNSVVQISPAGQVTLNVAGSGVNNPVDFTGGSLSNTTGVPNNFQINYGGTGGVNISGGSGSYLVVDAPNAPVKLTGGSDMFGVVVGNTISDSGGTNFHVDRSAEVGTVPPSGNYVLLSFRHVAY